MEKTPWRAYKIKKPWKVSPYPQLFMIPKILNMCRQAQFKTCHHQNSDVVYILVLILYSFLLTIINPIL